VGVRRNIGALWWLSECMGWSVQSIFARNANQFGLWQPWGFVPSGTTVSGKTNGNSFFSSTTHLLDNNGNGRKNMKERRFSTLQIYCETSSFWFGMIMVQESIRFLDSFARM
jgi:hypothetical protein